MADKKKERNGKNEDGALRFFDERRHLMVGIFLFALSLFLTLSSFNLGGVAGANVRGLMTYFFGIGYFVLPLFLAVLAFFSIKSMGYPFAWFKTLGLFLFSIGILAGIELFFGKSGGLIGKSVADYLLLWFDFYGSVVLLSAALFLSLLSFTDPVPFLHSVTDAISQIVAGFRNLFRRSDDKMVITGEIGEEESVEGEDEQENEEPAEEGASDSGSDETIIVGGEEEKSVKENIVVGRKWSKAFIPPPLSLLEKDRGRADVGDIKANANIIKRTLANFGIVVEMDEISIGPTVTRYALKPAEGVKLSRIVALQNDLALSLAAHPIRIEAPIPGKSLVGIEIPNTTKSTVGLGNLLSSEEYVGSGKPLLFALGKGISGKSFFANLGKMPHLLIAGATGSGKSVAIHTIIASLLYRNSPENLRFLMIDPKRVELTLYNKIPHLLTPVITDAKKTIVSLRWAAKEMERRYNILESESVRDIESYHKNVYGPAIEKMKADGKETADASMPELLPYIIIIIDELADIMQTYPRELEAAIVRLAQMSRAVGIHLILSTQRPSVNVITGLIKANIPARIALQVASQIDSRTILDMSGAEKLLGQGDMLYLSGEMSQPQRIQCPFISETEVKKVVSFLKDEYKDELPDEIFLGTMGTNVESNGENFGDGDDDIDDDLYEAAREEVMRAGKASTSYLQRKLRVGYARAARIIDLLEERGVIGPGDGAKPREVLGPMPAVETTNGDGGRLE